MGQAERPLPGRGHSLQFGATRKRLVWLTIFRLFIAFVLLSATLLFGLSGPATTPWLAQNLLYHATGGMVLVSLVFAYLLERFESEAWLRLLGLTQIVLDAVFASTLVLTTGGVESIFTFLFSLFIISASVGLYRVGGLVSAAASSVCFFLILIIQFGVFGQPQALSEVLGFVDVHTDAARVLSLNFSTNIVAFFAVAFLGSFLTEQIRDADSRLEAQKINIRELRNLYENIISSIENGLMTLDNELNVSFVNDYGAKWLGLSDQELIGKPVSTFFPDLWPILSNPDKVGRSHTEITIRAQEDRIRTLRWTINPLRDSNEQLLGRVLLFWDITEILEMEQRMNRADRMATIGRLAANIAHEIRNPLASMGGSIQLLQSLLKLDGDEKRLMDIVLHEAEHLNKWINEFLSYAKTPDPNPEPCDLAELAGAVIGLVEHEARAGNMKLSLLAKGDTIVRCDQKALRQTIWNLVNNAVDASKAGDAISLELDGTDPLRLLLAVQDEGAGIPPEHVEKIFDPFFSTKEMGTGLGLAIVQRNIEQHGGKIRVFSTLGKGTRFEVSLPRHTGRRAHGKDTGS